MFYKQRITFAGRQSAIPEAGGWSTHKFSSHRSRDARRAFGVIRRVGSIYARSGRARLLGSVDRSGCHKPRNGVDIMIKDAIFFGKVVFHPFLGVDRVLALAQDADGTEGCGHWRWKRRII